MLCPRQCVYNTCKYFHLNHDLLEDLVFNRRPFNENLQNEVNRIAYIYFGMLRPADKIQYCMGFLTGGRCSQATCFKCFQKTDYPACNSCGKVLTRGITQRLSCGHMFCDDCITVLPIKVDALLLYQCIVCDQYGLTHPVY
ncbi:hypothetical protein RN001_012226 [Aquatica leii]|nr:hypothetical protein RN001_012226 [Aquatica leii]